MKLCKLFISTSVCLRHAKKDTTYTGFVYSSIVNRWIIYLEVVQPENPYEIFLISCEFRMRALYVTDTFEF